MAYQPSRRKKHLLLSKDELNLTSMMDMMTIILLFLLKTYSTTGAILTPSEDLKLPYSLSEESPKKEVNVAVTRHSILIGNDLVLNLSDLNMTENLIPSLFTRLAQLAQEAKNDEIQFGKPFNNEVIIQADEDTPFQIIVKVLYTCGQSEFNKLRLLTYREQ